MQQEKQKPYIGAQEEALVRDICQHFGMGVPKSIVRAPFRGKNKAYFINHRYVLRFNDFDRQDSRFANEAFAYKILESSDIPIPKVMALDETKKVFPLNILITTRLVGEPVALMWPKMPEDLQKRVAFQAGEYLALVHQNEFHSFGSLKALRHLRGERSWKRYIKDYYEKYIERAKTLKIYNVKILDKVEKIYQEHLPLCAPIKKSSLVHNDYHWGNVLCDGETVTGLIDFEGACAVDPATDFYVMKRMEERCRHSTHSFCKGYQTLRPFEKGIEKRVKFYWILVQIELMVRFTQKKEADHLKVASDIFYGLLRSYKN